MEVINPRCCGIDVHKRSVTACCLTPGADGRPAKAIRTFETMTDGILALRDWLQACGVTTVAMDYIWEKGLMPMTLPVWVHQLARPA